MAHKTFISYKYSEAQDLRDKIIRALGSDGTFYRGETSDSPDLTDTSTENIKRHLTAQIYDTSVMIVIVSPNMNKSKWIDWEIEYCLKEIPRKERTSHTNGVVGVIMNVWGNCEWIKNHGFNCHGNPIVKYADEYLFPIISNNRYNSTPPLCHCESCKTFDFMNGSYITLVDEEDFLKTPRYYIDNAFDKSENVSRFILTKQR